MTRELIEDFTKIVKPFVQKKLLEENFEGMGEQDKAEFGRDFDEILSLAIKGLESSTWIPVNERLPKDGQLVIVSYPYDVSDLSRKRVMTAWYNTNYGFTCGIIDAWMPLPQPYKAESEDER